MNNLLNTICNLFTNTERLNLYITHHISVGLDAQDRLSFRVFNSKDEVIHEYHGVLKNVYQETFEYISNNHDKFIMLLVDKHKNQTYHFSPNLPFNYTNPTI